MSRRIEVPPEVEARIQAGCPTMRDDVLYGDRIAQVSRSRLGRKMREMGRRAAEERERIALSALSRGD